MLAVSTDATDRRRRLAALNRARAARIASLEPLSRTSKPTDDERGELARLHADAGLRPFPYPFNAALAITSDIDRSDRDNYFAFVHQLVRDGGLDFGDSIWLGSNHGPAFAGLSILTPWLGCHCDAAEDQLDLLDVLREHHLGNIDHWHSFVRRGPRFAVVDQLEMRDDHAIAAMKPMPRAPDLFHAIESFYILGAIVFGTWPGDDPVEQMHIECAGFRPRASVLTSTPTTLPLPPRQSAPDERHQLLIWDRPADSPEQPAHLPRVRRVRLDLRSGEAVRISRVLLLNLYPGLLQDRLAWLRSNWHWSTNLITRHGHWHFNDELDSPSSAGRQGTMSLARLREHRDARESYMGSLLDLAPRCSTVADEPGSFARVYPEIVDEHGLRFLRADANGYPCRSVLREPEDFQPSVFDLVYPCPRRDGGHVYFVRSTKSFITPDEAATLGLPNRGSSRRPTFPTTLVTFPTRINRLLDGLERGPGCASMFYTHVGNLMPDDVRPEPYVEAATVRRLQTHAHGVGPNVPDTRVWFTRASVLAEYCAVAQNLSGAIHRDTDEPSTVRIASWEDPFTASRVGARPEQLYGQTIYVDDAARAQVLLDGTPVRELVRNPPDESGRASVTIAACGIRHVVFRDCDPRLRHETSRANVDVAWHPTPARPGVAFRGALELAPRASNPGRLTIHPRDISPTGCQHLSFHVMRDPRETSIGMLLVTTTGGHFFFGDASMRAAVGPLDAWYDLPPVRPDADGWACCAVPFYALTWSEDLREPPPLPAHAPAQLTLMVDGPAGARVRVAALEYGRPKTTTPDVRNRTLVVGGRARGCAGVGVTLTSLHGLSPARTTTTDDSGGYAFVGVEPGAYRVEAKRRGVNAVEVECFCDRFDVDLGRRRRTR